MSEERFLDRADAFERALLGSARRDGMSPDRKRALALALALGAGAAAATLGAAGTAKAAGAGAGAAAAKVKGTATLAALKWILAGVAGGALAVGAAGGAARIYESEVASSAPAARGRALGKAAPAPRPVPAPSPRAVEPPAPPAEAAPAEEPVAATDAVAVAALPSAAPPAPARAPSRPTAPGLADEIRTLARARAALASGDTAAASRALDEHDRRFPAGALAEEARVLRIDVLARRDHAAAVSAARAFVAAHPASPHAPRLRELAGEGSAP